MAQRCWARATAPRRAGVGQRQVQRERAALARRAHQPDLAAEQRRQLAADGEAETGAAVLAAGAGVGLLERLEDQPLLLRRDADAGVGDLDGDGALREPQNRMIRRPARASTGCTRIDTWPCEVNLNAFDSRFFRICCRRFGSLVNARGSVLSMSTWKREVLRLGDVVERALDAVAQRREGDLLGLDRDRARLDLRQVENVVDQRQQVGAGRVDVPGELDLLARRGCRRCSRRAAGRESESS